MGLFLHRKRSGSFSGRTRSASSAAKLAKIEFKFDLSTTARGIRKFRIFTPKCEVNKFRRHCFLMIRLLLLTSLPYIAFTGEASFFPTRTPLEGLNCTAETVQLANSAQLCSILSELSESTFFRLVRINPESPALCPIASLRDAESASTCDSDPFAPFAPSRSLVSNSLCAVEPVASPQQTFASSVVSSISPAELSAQMEFPRDNECALEVGSFKIRPDYWLDICGLPHAGEYVNLRLNPERNTGYNGRVVWEAMHEEIGLLEEFEEGRILARIFSGFHASVTTHIMSSYFPPSSFSSWRPNPEKFTEYMTPERKKNMQFAYVVLLRSLFKIKDFLYTYPFSTGNEREDAVTASLVRRLLDSSVLSACEAVTSGFDESVMFRPLPGSAESALRFKKIFRKVTRMVDCVACKRCRLHATVAVHGIGVALKILLTSAELVTETITRDDIVALVNTVQKFSSSLELAASGFFDERKTDTKEERKVELLALVKQYSGELTVREQDALVEGILKENGSIFLLSKVFSGHSLLRYALLSMGVVVPDAVIIGGGLAGLVTAVSIADRGGSVVVVEKTNSLGGNSAKASSGINWIKAQEEEDSFFQDTIKSQNGAGKKILAEILIKNANASVSWLEQVTGVNLTSSVSRLGGHTFARTWKPLHGLVGAELVAGLIGAVKRRYPAIEILTNARVTRLLPNQTGVQLESDGALIHARSVVIASGGFGFEEDNAHHQEGMLKKYRPDLAELPTTLGAFSTGDGIRIASEIGADLIDMHYVQLHPTGFVDPANPEKKVKVLAAEVLRGVGGVLLNSEGERFVNELETRKIVTEAMLLQKNKVFWLEEKMKWRIATLIS